MAAAYTMDDAEAIPVSAQLQNAKFCSNTEAEPILQALFYETVILSEAKDLLSRGAEESRSFASLRMTE